MLPYIAAPWILWEIKPVFCRKRYTFHSSPSETLNKIPEGFGWPIWSYHIFLPNTVQLGNIYIYICNHYEVHVCTYLDQQLSNNHWRLITAFSNESDFLSWIIKKIIKILQESSRKSRKLSNSHSFPSVLPSKTPGLPPVPGDFPGGPRCALASAAQGALRRAAAEGDHEASSSEETTREDLADSERLHD